MVAFDHGRRLCTALLRRGEPRRYAYPGCTRPSGQLRELALPSDSEYRRGRIRTWHWGVVAPEVATVELVLARGRTVRAPAEEGSAYHGRYAGKVRFVVVEARGRLGHEYRYARLLAADGTLLAIVDRFGSKPDRVGRRVELARGRRGGATWAFRAFRQRVLSPLAGDEERFVVEPCLELRRPGRRSLVEVCRHPDFPRDEDSYNRQQTCGPVGTAAIGTVPERTRAVIAVLGDGRARRLRLRRLPPGYGEGRAFALVLGRDVAVRRLVAITRAGHRRMVDRGIAPGAVRCGEDSTVFGLFGYEEVRPRGPAALTVYDDGVLLCATLGRPTRSRGECSPPPLDPYEASIMIRRRGDRALLAGVLPGYVTRAVVELDGGERIAVDTTDAPYAGRYAGLVRFFTLELDRDRVVEAVRLFDGRGRRVIRVTGIEGYRPAGRARVVVGGPPGLRLRARLLESPGDPTPHLCVRLGASPCAFGSTSSLAVESQCSPRRLVLWGLTPSGVEAVTVETDRGDVAARLARLPRALRPNGSRVPRWLRRELSASAFVAVLPARAAPRGLVMAGRQRQHRRLALPPASAQCGYADQFVDL